MASRSRPTPSSCWPAPRGAARRTTIEVFPEPSVDNGVARCRFLVRGVRYVAGAQEAVDSLSVGDRLCILLDPQNPVDACAVLLRDEALHLLGWVPRYLTELVRTRLAQLGPEAINIRAQHVGRRDGPMHLRLLCALEARWPDRWRGPSVFWSGIRPDAHVRLIHT